MDTHKHIKMAEHLTEEVTAVISQENGVFIEEIETPLLKLANALAAYQLLAPARKKSLQDPESDFNDFD